MILKYIFSAGLAMVLILTLISALRTRITGAAPRRTGIVLAGFIVAAAAVLVLTGLFIYTGDWNHLFRAAIPAMFLTLFYTELRK